jgi:hypothetical protein
MPSVVPTLGAEVKRPRAVDLDPEAHAAPNSLTRRMKVTEVCRFARGPRGTMGTMLRRSCVEMYEDFIKEHEKTRDAFRAEMRADYERRREELDAKFGKIDDEIDITREGQRRGFGGLTADMNNSRQTTREMLLRLEELRERLVDIQFGIRSNTEGLLHVLAELRREDRAGAAGA